MIFFQEIEVGDMVRFRFGNEAERVALNKTTADHNRLFHLYNYIIYKI